MSCQVERPSGSVVAISAEYLREIRKAQWEYHGQEMCGKEIVFLCNISLWMYACALWGELPYSRSDLQEDLGCVCMYLTT